MNRAIKIVFASLMVLIGACTSNAPMISDDAGHGGDATSTTTADAGGDLDAGDGGCFPAPPSTCGACYGANVTAATCPSAPDILEGPYATCTMVSPEPDTHIVNKAYCCVPPDITTPSAGCEYSEAASVLCACAGMNGGAVCAGPSTIGCTYLPYSGNQRTQTHIECCGE